MRCCQAGPGAPALRGPGRGAVGPRGHQHRAVPGFRCHEGASEGAPCGATDGAGGVGRSMRAMRCERRSGYPAVCHGRSCPADKPRGYGASLSPCHRCWDIPPPTPSPPFAAGPGGSGAGAAPLALLSCTWRGAGTPPGCRTRCPIRRQGGERRALPCGGEKDVCWSRWGHFVKHVLTL